MKEKLAAPWSIRLLCPIERYADSPPPLRFDLTFIKYAQWAEANLKTIFHFFFQVIMKNSSKICNLYNKNDHNSKNKNL